MLGGRKAFHRACLCFMYNNMYIWFDWESPREMIARSKCDYGRGLTWASRHILDVIYEPSLGVWRQMFRPKGHWGRVRICERKIRTWEKKWRLVALYIILTVSTIHGFSLTAPQHPRKDTSIMMPPTIIVTVAALRNGKLGKRVAKGPSRLSR